MAETDIEMRIYFLLLGLVLLLLADLRAQDTEDRSNTTDFKAGYFELGGSLGTPFFNVGGTLVYPDNLLIGLRYAYGATDAPQKPGDYARPATTITSPNGSGGGIIDPNLLSGRKEKPDEPTKKYHIISAGIGKIWALPHPAFRLRAELGMSALFINEAVDFVYVPASVTTDGKGWMITQHPGYSYSRDKYTRIGGHVRSGMEIALTDIVGLFFGGEAYLAKEEWLPGLFVGILLGRM